MKRVYKLAEGLGMSVTKNNKSITIRGRDSGNITIEAKSKTEALQCLRYISKIKKVGMPFFGK